MYRVITHSDKTRKLGIDNSWGYNVRGPANFISWGLGKHNHYTFLWAVVKSAIHRNMQPSLNLDYTII